MIRVGIVGATGYVGSELVRLLLGHPGVTIAAVVSRGRAGVPYGDAVPALAGVDLVLADPPLETLGDLDAVFFCTPHGVARDLAAKVSGRARLFDLSSDHRADPAWVYGLAEWQGDALVGATRVAVPGCFATAIALALAPLVGVIRGRAQVCAGTGSTGSGVAPARGTHHPERFVNVKAYKPLTHQHVPEIEAMLRRLGDFEGLSFVPLSLPLDRGIYATCFADVDPAVDVGARFRDAYGGRPLVRLRAEPPDLRHVRGTAFTDLAWSRQGAQVVVFSAIDNLIKGAAGQAVQALNLSFGWPVATGLGGLPCTP